MGPLSPSNALSLHWGPDIFAHEGAGPPSAMRGTAYGQRAHTRASEKETEKEENKRSSHGHRQRQIWGFLYVPNQRGVPGHQTYHSSHLRLAPRTAHQFRYRPCRSLGQPHNTAGPRNNLNCQNILAQTDYLTQTGSFGVT